MLSELSDKFFGKQSKGVVRERNHESKWSTRKVNVIEAWLKVWLVD